MRKIILLFLLLTLPLRAFAVEPITIALGVSLVINAAIWSIVFDNDGKAGISQSSAPDSGFQFSVQLSPSKESIVPAGWSAPVTPTSDPVPPLLASPMQGQYVYAVTVGDTNATPIGACAAWLSRYSGSFPGYKYSMGDVSETSCSFQACPTSGGTCTVDTRAIVKTYASTPTCPYTYTYQGGGCSSTADTASKAVYPENTPLVVKTAGSAPSFSPRNPTKLPPYVKRINANQLQITSTDGKETTKITYDPSTGNTSIEITAAGSGSSGSIQSDRVKLDVDKDGRVKGVDRSVVSGAGTLVSNNPVSGSASMDTSGLAKTGEAQAAANSIKAGQCGGSGQPKCSMDDSAFNGQSAGGQSSYDSAIAARDGFHNGLPNAINSLVPAVGYSWVPSLMPGEAVGCQPIPLNVSFSSGLLSGIHGEGSIDICGKLGIARSVLGYLLGLYTLIYIYRVFSRSQKD